jgi:hypothetical protein
MKFMLFFYPDRSVELGADEKAAVRAAVGAWVSEMDARVCDCRVMYSLRSVRRRRCVFAAER